MRCPPLPPVSLSLSLCLCIWLAGCGTCRRRRVQQDHRTYHDLVCEGLCMFLCVCVGWLLCLLAI